MKFILLAAGKGSRLLPETKIKPKTLVKINGKPILEYILIACDKAGLKQIIICTGFKASQIVNFCKNFPHLNFTFVENKKYKTTNNIYSIYLAIEYLNDDIIVMDADTIVSTNIISGLVKQKKTSLATALLHNNKNQ